MFQDLDRFCDSVMRATVTLGRERVQANLDRAVEVLREEVKAFFFDERYADLRDCVLRRSLSDRVAVADVATNVVARL